MKSFMKEFKEFISKGNVMSMAVGIIIGSAFTAIVTSIMYGNFIQAIITFLITAFTLFLILKAFNRFTAKKEAQKEEPEEPAPIPEDIKLLTEIRDLLQK